MVHLKRPYYKIKMSSYEKFLSEFNKQLSVGNLTIKNQRGLSKIKPDSIVLTGMGGSGLAGDLLQGLAPAINLKIPIIAWKNYGLPLTNFKKPLFIFVSFSGNTEETISGLKKLLTSRKKNVALVTTNGLLKKLGEKNALPLITFPAQGLTARESLGYTYYSVLKLLKFILPSIKIRDLNNLNPEKLKTQGKKLARIIKGKIPLIYTDPDNTHLGYIWKTNLNETAKQLAFTNTIPEMAHNEITGFEDKSSKNFIALFLKDSEADQKIIKKAEAVQKILKKHKIQNQTISLTGKNKEQKTWNAIILSHFASLYLSKLKKIDPRKTRLIDELKKIN